MLDFANEADTIQAAVEPYYEANLLSEATDPNLLYENQTRLASFPVYTEADVDAFAKVYFDPKAKQDRLYAVLTPVVERFEALSEDEKHDFRGRELFAKNRRTIRQRWRGIRSGRRCLASTQRLMLPGPHQWRVAGLGRAYWSERRIQFEIARTAPTRPGSISRSRSSENRSMSENPF